MIYIVADMERILRLIERWKDAGALVVVELPVQGEEKGFMIIC